jgi:hypothetical protein
MSDRVSERRRAAALARHYRERENLTIAEIARRLGRTEAKIKAYLYDPSDANKRPTDQPAGATVLGAPGHARTSICKRLLGSRCDGTRPVFLTTRFVPGAAAAGHGGHLEMVAPSLKTGNVAPAAGVAASPGGAGACDGRERAHAARPKRQRALA